MPVKPIRYSNRGRRSWRTKAQDAFGTASGRADHSCRRLVAGVATGVVARCPSATERVAADGLRSIGLGVSEINEIQRQSDEGSGLSQSPVRPWVTANALTKLLNQNDQYEIGEWYYHDLGLVEPGEGVSANRHSADQGLGQGHQSHQDWKVDA